MFAVLDDETNPSVRVLSIESVGDSLKDDEIAKVSSDIKEKAYQWCSKYEMLFRVISVEEELETA